MLIVALLALVDFSYRRWVRRGARRQRAFFD
jgi:hypothetical protein